jgi:hypothetical protein
MQNNGRSPVEVLAPSEGRPASTQEYIDRTIDEVLGSLPNPERLSYEERRGIVARYTAVLEGNFIYWMTAAYFSVGSQEARAIIEDNLREEVRDNHPGMLRKFAAAANAVPRDSDLLAIQRNLQEVRSFVAGMSGVQMLLMMAFFEGLIQRFMPYLEGLAVRQGSSEKEYTVVHGVCDVLHTQELYRAYDEETKIAQGNSMPPAKLTEGVDVLRKLIEKIIHPRAASQVSH